MSGPRPNGRFMNPTLVMSEGHRWTSGRPVVKGDVGSGGARHHPRSANSTATDGWDDAQDQLAALSTNSFRRTVASTHEGLLADPGPAAESVRAMTAVVDSVRSGDPLGTP